MNESKKILNGKTALITGGGRGIGKEVARVYAREGCTLALVARTEKELAETASLIRAESGVAVEICAVDVSDLDAVGHAVARAYERMGSIDIAVNAAAIVEPIGLAEECDPFEWKRVIEVNLFGTYHIMRSVLPCMKKAKHGAIINFSGGGAFGPFPHFSAYASSKAAVVRLTETVAEEVWEDGITVNALSPGAVNTNMFDDILSAGASRMGERQWREFEEREKKGGDSVEAACNLALFLASEEARDITGKTISARWDPWKRLPERIDELMSSDIYTLRRIKPEDRGKKWE